MAPTDDSIVLTREQCRAVDRYAIETLGITGIVLMENAGRNAAEYIVQRLHAERTSADDMPFRAAILCGNGNNGGDGFVVARHLLRHGWEVTVYLAADPAALTGDAAINYAPLSKLGIQCVQIDSGQVTAAATAWDRADVIVDAVLGTGFSGQVREPVAAIIRAVNTLKHPLVVAIDIPSGLDADRGEPGGVAIEADCTITFLARKPGFTPSATQFTGEIVVADIGLPLHAVIDHLNG